MAIANEPKKSIDADQTVAMASSQEQVQQPDKFDDKVAAESDATSDISPADPATPALTTPASDVTPVTLQDLPQEVLGLIFKNNYGSPIVDISVRDSYFGQPSTRLFCGVPIPIAGLRNVLSTSHTLREGAMMCISDNTHFVCNARSLNDLPTAFGRANCKLVKTLSIKFFHEHKVYDSRWAGVQEMLRQALPNLQMLVIWGLHQNDPFRDVGSSPEFMNLSRQEQDVLCFINFAASLRHSNLPRLVYPCHAGPNFEPGETVLNQVILDTGFKRKHWSKKLKWADTSRNEPMVEVEDVVLNATLIRHTKKSDMATLPLAHFVLQPKQGENPKSITTSETTYNRELYDLFEERAYRTRDAHDAKGWAVRTKDQLLDFCHEVHNLGIPKEQNELKTRVITMLDNNEKALQKVTKERDDARHNAREKQSDIDLLTEDVADLEATIEDLKQQKNALRSDVARLEADCRHWEDEYNLAALRLDRKQRPSKDWMDLLDGVEEMHQSMTIRYEKMVKRRTMKNEDWADDLGLDGLFAN